MYIPFRVFRELEIPGPVLIEPVVFHDERGIFKEIYKRTDFLSNYIPYDFVQANVSISRRGVIRGLHYQLRPAEQGKLVTVLRGRIFDVAVDIRRRSRWYGAYVAVELSEENHRLLWVPPGFAHGFQSLEDNTVVLYLVTKEYSPAHERCIRWDDPRISIQWPIDNVVVSEKDRNCPLLDEAETNF